MKHDEARKWENFRAERWGVEAKELLKKSWRFAKQFTRAGNAKCTNTMGGRSWQGRLRRMQQWAPGLPQIWNDLKALHEPRTTSHNCQCMQAPTLWQIYACVCVWVCAAPKCCNMLPSMCMRLNAIAISNQLTHLPNVHYSLQNTRNFSTPTAYSCNFFIATTLTYTIFLRFLHGPVARIFDEQLVAWSDGQSIVWLVWWWATCE